MSLKGMGQPSVGASLDAKYTITAAAVSNIDAMGINFEGQERLICWYKGTANISFTDYKGLPAGTVIIDYTNSSTKTIKVKTGAEGVDTWIGATIS